LTVGVQTESRNDARTIEAGLPPSGSGVRRLGNPKSYPTLLCSATCDADLRPAHVRCRPCAAPRVVPLCRHRTGLTAAPWVGLPLIRIADERICVRTNKHATALNQTGISRRAGGGVWHLEALPGGGRSCVVIAACLSLRPCQYLLAYPSRHKAAPTEASNITSLSPKPSHAPASHFAKLAQARSRSIAARPSRFSCSKTEITSSGVIVSSILGGLQACISASRPPPISNYAIAAPHHSAPHVAINFQFSLSIAAYVCTSRKARLNIAGSGSTSPQCAADRSMNTRHQESPW